MSRLILVGALAALLAAPAMAAPASPAAPAPAPAASAEATCGAAISQPGADPRLVQVCQALWQTEHLAESYAASAKADVDTLAQLRSTIGMLQEQTTLLKQGTAPQTKH